jgi:hypothetical protein
MTAEELKKYTRWLAGWAVFVYLAGVLLSQTPLNRDDSDPGDWGRRSGLVPRVDYLTGCQYLQTTGGGITPRLDKAGTHIGCR